MLRPGARLRVTTPAGPITGRLVALRAGEGLMLARGGRTFAIRMADIRRLERSRGVGGRAGAGLAAGALAGAVIGASVGGLAVGLLFALVGMIVGGVCGDAMWRERWGRVRVATAATAPAAWSAAATPDAAGTTTS